MEINVNGDVRARALNAVTPTTPGGEKKIKIR